MAEHRHTSVFIEWLRQLKTGIVKGIVIMIQAEFICQTGTGENLIQIKLLDLVFGLTYQAISVIFSKHTL